MVKLTLSSADSIETVLPVVEQAMNNGETCSIRNINYLGCIHVAALALLAMSGSLMDMSTGQVVRAQPGFRLVGIDDHGVRRTMAR